MRKIIFIDIDGTLCNSNGEVTNEVVNAIKKIQDNGGIIVISSGRNIKDIEAFNTGALYFIALNGSIIYSSVDKKIIYQNFIDKKFNERLYKLADELNLEISFNSFSNRYCNCSETGSIDIDSNYKEFLDLDFNQVVIWKNDFDKMLTAKMLLKDFPLLKVVNQSRDMVYEDRSYVNRNSFLDITNNDVSKGNAIKFLLDYLGLSKEESIAIGDGINDLSMFYAVHTKVAMGNADSFLKEKADYVTLSNDENGVAYYLEKLLK